MSLFWLVMELATHEPAAADLVRARGFAAAAVVRTATDATWDEAEALLGIAHHESRFDPRAVNPHGGDCGPTQIRHPELWGSSCARILADPAEGYRVALRILRHARTVCPGTWTRVLTVYASGVCGGAPRKARELCAPVGLCDRPYVVE